MIKALGVSGFLLLMGLVVFPALAVTPASAADFSKPGPFAIGVREFAIPDATGEEAAANICLVSRHRSCSRYSSFDPVDAGRTASNDRSLSPGGHDLRSLDVGG